MYPDKNNFKKEKDHVRELSISDGKMPPSAVEFEKIIIGTLLVDLKAYDMVIKRFGKNEDVFYDPRHQQIFKSIKRIKEKDSPIDLMTVIQELKRTEKLSIAGGDNYIIDLSMGVSSSAHLEHHCMVVLEKYLLRKVINISMQMINEAYSETTDMFELFAKLQNAVHDIEEEIASQQETATAQQLFVQVLEQQKEKTIPGVPCKNRDIQMRMNGWRNGSLVVIGARPAMGKTAFVLDEALGIAKKGDPVAFVSFEMSALELQERQMANELEISGNKFRDRNLTDYDWQRISECSTFENLPLYIIEGKSVGFDLYRTMAKLRLLKKEKGLKMIIWDYIQLTEVSGLDKGKNREQIISTISRKMKQLAQELDLPIVALSQLSRSVESRPGKRPMLSDLRESGAIEQDADVVGFLFRPEYYKIEKWDNDPEGAETDTKGQVELMIEKFRGGSVFTERMKFRGDYQKFFPIETDFDYQNPVPLGNLKDAFGEIKTENKIEEDDDFKF
ncbi:replicative DNA helicase [Epilithonimonas xixisoli]|uniref:DNA 5'-3' helicase n=1 Tax=Epilithonimonas xixisoli TaxID=1476462 RepID=A0A4R8I6G8_9FLAO|nr:replicative DNA helicase [Epilithonimonas xixisoli]TDX83955.1 replicative DNA helicase [Epilithonimonas xixisoli]